MYLLTVLFKIFIYIKRGYNTSLLLPVLVLVSLSTLSIANDNLSVIDDLGRTITLQKPAQRIISLAPHTTEMLFAAGAGHQIIGVVSYSDYPDAAKKIQIIGGYKRVDMELILSLQPDLIVGWQSGNGTAHIEQIKQFNIPLYLTEPRALEDIPKSIRNLGHLTGNSSSASLASNRFLVELSALKNTYSQLPKVSVFYQVWDQPLITINGEHIISNLIKLCGGSNVFANLSSLAPRIDIESVLLNDPTVIIASGMGERRPDWLDSWRTWDNLKAVKNDNLFFIPPDIVQRHTPRILLGARQMCEQLQQVRKNKQKAERQEN